MLFLAYMKRALERAGEKASEDYDGFDTDDDGQVQNNELSNGQVKQAIEQARSKMEDLLMKDDLKLEELDEVLIFARRVMF